MTSTSSLLSGLLSDPTSTIELLAMLFSAIYLCRAALSPIMNSADALKEEPVRPSSAFSNSLPLSDRFSLSDRLLTLFEVGGYIRLPKRSLMSQHITR